MAEQIDDMDTELIDDEEFSTMNLYNATPFLQREKYMYSFGDIKFTTPKSLTKMMYLAMFLAVYSLPIIVFVGFQLNPWFLAITFIPPFVLSHYASKPVFDGRMLPDWIQVQINYLTRGKRWTESKENKKPDISFYTNFDHIWISRRKDYALLDKQDRGEIRLEDNLYI